MTTLTREQIIDAAQKVKKGTYVRIGYRTELPVKAELKKQGCRVYKYTETTVRLGVNYGKISTVIARNAKENILKNKPNNYEWAVKDLIKHNTNTGKDYLFVAVTGKSGSNTKEMYNIQVEGGGIEVTCIPEIFREEFSDIIIPSYWTKKDASQSEVKNISFDNICRIGDSGKDNSNCIF